MGIVDTVKGWFIDVPVEVDEAAQVVIVPSFTIPAVEDAPLEAIIAIDPVAKVAKVKLKKKAVVTRRTAIKRKLKAK